MPLHPSYSCSCQHPNPQKYKGEETGLCTSCNLVYDDRLYEMRLRQHVTGFTYDSLDDFLNEVDPIYRSLKMQADD